MGFQLFGARSKHLIASRDQARLDLVDVRAFRVGDVHLGWPLHEFSQPRVVVLRRVVGVENADAWRVFWEIHRASCFRVPVGLYQIRFAGKIEKYSSRSNARQVLGFRRTRSDKSDGKDIRHNPKSLEPGC